MFGKTLSLCILGVSVGIHPILYNRDILAEVSNVPIRSISSFTLA